MECNGRLVPDLEVRSAESKILTSCDSRQKPHYSVVAFTQAVEGCGCD